MDDVKNKTGYVIKGMRGPVVKELQQMLINLGYDLGPSKDDSIFGDKTLEAITNFQKKSSIRPKNNKFGIFGSLTLEKMNQAIAQK
jgi:peptidoglycan hydrolase-like protein with peptidoglycan-binding domain